MYPAHIVTIKGDSYEFWKGKYYKRVGYLSEGMSFGELALINQN